MKLAVMLLCLILAFPGGYSYVAKADDTGESAGVINVTGRIKHYSYEGGFYGIEGDDGNVYKPIDLDPGFQIEGQAVQAELRPRDKKILFKPWGMPVEVLNIKRVRK